jgi:hypothetical protein
MNALHIAMAILEWGLVVAVSLTILLLLLAEVLDRYWSTAVQLIALAGKHHPIQLQMPHEIAVLLLRAGLK